MYLNLKINLSFADHVMGTWDVYDFMLFCESFYFLQEKISMNGLKKSIKS